MNTVEVIDQRRATLIATIEYDTAIDSISYSICQMYGSYLFFIPSWSGPYMDNQPLEVLFERLKQHLQSVVDRHGPIEDILYVGCYDVDPDIRAKLDKFAEELDAILVIAAAEAAEGGQ